MHSGRSLTHGRSSRIVTRNRHRYMWRRRLPATTLIEPLEQHLDAAECVLLLLSEQTAASSSQMFSSSSSAGCAPTSSSWGAMHGQSRVTGYLSTSMSECLTTAGCTATPSIMGAFNTQDSCSRISQLGSDSWQADSPRILPPHRSPNQNSSSFASFSVVSVSALVSA